MSITPNEGQTRAIDFILQFLRTPTKREMLLQGSAGTGKTTCVNFVVRHSPLSFVFTAPTNKAVKVLADMVNRILDGIVPSVTIYKLLGLRLDNDGEVRTIEQDKERVAANLQNVDVIVIDEASMVNKALKQKINEALMEFPKIKVIYMGDPFQLPPVKEEYSPAMAIPDVVTLTKVERHDNQILTLATHIRDCILNGGTPDLISNNDDKGGVFCVKRNRFFELIGECYERDAYKEKPNYAKAMAWRNEAVGVINDYVRGVLYKELAHDAMFHVGERVVACSPVCDVQEKKNGQFIPLMATDEEGTVNAVKITPHPVFRQVVCYWLMIQPEYGDEPIECYVPHEKYRVEYDMLLNNLADKAKARQGSWAAFWDCKDMFPDVRPCHAITAHRSQGSTYEIAFVNAIDILSNRNRLESMKCLYVAATRPSRVLVVNK